MKKILFIVCIILTGFISCKNNTNAEQTEVISDDYKNTEKQSDELTLLKGEFVFYDGAAVLQTPADIYGVFLNDKLQELNTLALQYKKEPTDMVNIEIRGKISTQQDDKILWDNKVEIIEILNVSKPNPEDNNVVKLGK
jgi:carbonic anhydrase